MNRSSLLALVLMAWATSAVAQPSLRVQDRSGNAVVLPETGAVTLVQFMATWCAPCHEQTKAFVVLYETYTRRGVRMVGLSLDRTAEHKLLPVYVEDFSVPYPLLVGATVADLQRFARADMLPLTVIFDRDGQVFDTLPGLVATDVITARLDWLTGDRSRPRPPPFVAPKGTREEDELPHVHAAAMLAKQSGRRGGSLVPS